MRLRRGCVLAVVALGTHGCASENGALTGNYKLIGTVAGPLPLVLQYEGICPVNLLSGSLAFRDDRYDSAFRIVRDCPEGTDSVMPDPGARNVMYEVEGDTIIFRNEEGGAAGMGIRKGDTLTITGPQYTLIYVRE